MFEEEGHADLFAGVSEVANPLRAGPVSHPSPTHARVQRVGARCRGEVSTPSSGFRDRSFKRIPLSKRPRANRGPWIPELEPAASNSTRPGYPPSPVSAEPGPSIRRTTNTPEIPARTRAREGKTRSAVPSLGAAQPRDSLMDAGHNACQPFNRARSSRPHAMRRVGYPAIPICVRGPSSVEIQSSEIQSSNLGPPDGTASDLA